MQGEVVYAFVPVGRQDGAVHVRLGRKARPGNWRSAFHGLNSVETTLLEVRVQNAREAMGRLVEFLRGNAFFGPARAGRGRRQLGGWKEGRLMEATGMGNYWWRSTYSTSELAEIFAVIGWELSGRSGPAPGSADADEDEDVVRVQQAVGPRASAEAAEARTAAFARNWGRLVMHSD
jgi:hypothetical protein